MKTKLTYQQAKSLADKIILELAPACERVEIAGSIRRKKPEIGDIEIVCISKQELNLFAEPGLPLLYPRLDFLLQTKRIIRGDKWGANYRKFHPAAMPELSVDLFITTPEQWGVIFTIRTGSANFSHKLVTPRLQGGLLPSHLKVSGGRIWDGAKILETPEEQDVFKVCEIDWLKPEAR